MVYWTYESSKQTWTMNEAALQTVTPLISLLTKLRSVPLSLFLNALMKKSRLRVSIKGQCVLLLNFPRIKMFEFFL